MRKKLSRATLFLSLLLVLSGLAGLAVSADKPKSKKSAPPAAASPDMKKSKTSDPSKAAPAPAAKKVYLIKIDAPITPVVAEYIIKSIDKASDRKAEALIIQLNTPGGLLESTTDIVMRMIASEVPIVVYVAPSGGRAASAGVFITMAANLAVMAPTTHIGAASPIQLEGKMDETMQRKAMNDTAAWARGIAEKRGRNAGWAEDAVRKAVSATETEALKLKVIDFIAPDVKALVREIDGRTVDVVMGKKTIHTADAVVEELPMGFRYKLLGIISNPNIAYILMILGFYGLYFELSNPGAIFPGVAGAICLILAFYALQTLPINYAGLMLIILGIALFIAEAFITSHGVLGIGGTIAMLLGSVMLIDSSSPALQISWAVIIPAVALSALLFIITVSVAVKVYREKADTGKEGLIGMQALAKTDILADGQVFMRGEYWSAWSDEPISKGDKVTIISVEGLKLKVKKGG
ncbi:MAG TPA: nodulation protein NfeD [Nitrospirota bacterium]|nr:nodulation protein NfeD [Nitrospirota bacterium]